MRLLLATVWCASVLGAVGSAVDNQNHSQDVKLPAESAATSVNTDRNLQGELIINKTIFYKQRLHLLSMKIHSQEYVLPQSVY